MSPALERAVEHRDMTKVLDEILITPTVDAEYRVAPGVKSAERSSFPYHRRGAGASERQPEDSREDRAAGSIDELTTEE